MKKDSYPLNNELSMELSRRITETRARKAGVDFNKMKGDPALKPYFDAAKKNKNRKRPKLSISQKTIDKLAGY